MQHQHLGSLEFITDHLSHLSLSPQEGDSSAIFTGMVHSRMPSLHTTLEETFNEDGAASGAATEPLCTSSVVTSQRP
jgi:hypothetical protein